jgi:hypothetical protein
MFIAHGDWVVVTRHVRDSTSRGQIVKTGLTEDQAKALAKQILSHPTSKSINAWAFPKSEY